MIKDRNYTFFNIIVTIISLIFSLSLIKCSNNSDNSDPIISTNSDKQIYSFNLNALTPAVIGEINGDTHEITLRVPNGTTLASLVPTISFKGSTVSPASGVAHSFSDGIAETYTVTAEDGSTQEYAVTVNVSIHDIISFTVPGQINTADIEPDDHTVSVQIAPSASLTSITPTIEVSTGATISPVSGVQRDFSGGPLTYTVTGQDAVAQTWTVSVNHGNFELLSETGTFSYSVDLGSASKDVYFIFTNTDLDTGHTWPVISSMYPDQFLKIQKESLLVKNNNSYTPAKNEPLILKGKPEISEFNRNPFRMAGVSPVKTKTLSKISVLPRQTDVVGSYNAFYDDSTSNTIPSTCRKIVPGITTTFGAKTLNIWVANNCWIVGGTKKYRVTQTMVDAIANAFLKSGTDNDIYDWISGIFGEEWGSTVYSNLVGNTDNITILLCDIDNDNSDSGGVLGYFWSKDNFTRSSVSFSNERIMFYIDAVMFADPEDQYGDGNTTWSLTDFWPQHIISTLAHEFQHMINFYQKPIVHDLAEGTDTWIDEMCAMAGEDLVSKYLNVSGPRGVTYNDPGAGSSGNVNGRLPLYNYENIYQLTTWASGDDALKSYSIAYAYGAYLARNYGGAKFFRNIVHNEFTDHRAIEYALQLYGSSDTSFAGTLTKWGVANLLSDRVMKAPFKYNNGDSWITDSFGYSLGSINLYNYIYENVPGPRIYTDISTSIASSMAPSSNIYYLAGSNMTGLQTWDLNLNSNLRMSVVIKDHE